MTYDEHPGGLRRTLCHAYVAVQVLLPDARGTLGWCTYCLWPWQLRHHARAQVATLKQAGLTVRSKQEAPFTLFGTPEPHPLDALVPPPPAPACLKALGLAWPCTVAEVKQAYHVRAFQAHPDHGGSHAAWLRLQRQYEAALKVVGAA